MKIALVTYSFLPDIGGAQITLHNLALRLSKKGHLIVVLVPFSIWSKLKGKRNKLEYKIAPYFSAKIFSYLKKYPESYSKITDLQFSHFQRKYRFDIWLAWMSYPTAVAVGHWASKRNIPYAVRCAGADIQLFPEIGYGDRLDKDIDNLVRYWLPKANMLIALTNSVALEYKKIGISDEKITIIPCGVDNRRFQIPFDKTGLRNKYNLPQNKIIFITVGRNHPKKGFNFLVEAAKLLRKKGINNFVVVLVGKNMDSLMEKGKNLGISENLIFIEEKGFSEFDENLSLPSEEVISLYHAADICVFPTLMETFGVIPVEAWAAKIPVITTDAVGPSEIVRNGEDALVVKAGDSKDLSEKMALLMQNKLLQDRLIETGYKNAISKYDWEKVIEKWEELIKRIGEANRKNL
ncbi:MAG TPA: hypothetical protein DHV62_05430 [Elusimicrobia bacterium]|jgi:glycosyltransferase involved in cell wall biosynthesis|nr:hypothetical protein [Elusimicrobiota bacterium]